MERVGDIIDRNIKLIGADALTQNGFVQVPLVIVRTDEITMGAKMVYTALLTYAWHNDSCYPGQNRMADDIGSSRKSVNVWLKELEKKGYINIKRRGQGKSNMYEVNLKAKVLKRKWK